LDLARFDLFHRAHAIQDYLAELRAAALFCDKVRLCSDCFAEIDFGIVLRACVSFFQLHLSASSSGPGILSTPLELPKRRPRSPILFHPSQINARGHQT